MAEEKTILVTGGGGYLGSHCIVELLNEGFSVVAVDNFVNSFKGETQNLLIVSLFKTKVFYS
jgi:UDP-glucose 4-epimerase